MKIKRYFAKDMRQAIREIREEQGPDAVILSNRRVNNGIEIIAAVDYDESIFNEMSYQKSPQKPAYDLEPAGDVDLPGPAARQEKPARDRKQQDVEWVEDPAIREMKNEIKNLRGILENQLSSLTLADKTRNKPGFAGVLHRLTQLGISADLSEHLISQLDLSNDLEHAWRQVLAILAHQIKVTDDDILTRGGVVALVGPTGVGKTTSIAKLAARFTLRFGSREVALISTDSYRIGAQEQLYNFGKILGVPTYMASDEDELRSKINDLSDKRLVLIDTAGMSQRDLRLSKQLEALSDSSQLIRNYLVIAANTQTNTLNDVMRAYSHIRLDGCILSKLDETTSLGGALSTIIRYQLPVAYVSDGQRVPEDMHPARAHSLVSRAVTLMQQEEMMSERHPNPLIYGGNLTNAHV